MSVALPRSKSQATKTARIMRAYAADLRNAAAGFEQAAQAYAGGPHVRGEANGAMRHAFTLAQASTSLARHVLMSAKQNGVMT